jgi:nitroreductase/NAD-dependent dihydropyrimidine dehydrogenase PreA subunit
VAWLKKGSEARGAMTELTVRESCTRCGLCAFACPWKVIILQEGSLPRFRDGGAEQCNLCGHCESVCPSGSISVDDPRLQPVPSPSGDGNLGPRQLGGYLRMRRSVRRYREEPVDRASIEEVMEIVRFAPSGRNRQDVGWLIIHDSSEVRRLTQIAMEWMRETGAVGTQLATRFDAPGMVRRWEKGEDPLCLHAPHLVVAHASPENVVARTNATIALAHLDIVAPAFGLGTCWGGIFLLAVQSCEPLRGALQLPPERIAVHCLMLGYPAISFQRPPKRYPARIVWR